MLAGILLIIAISLLLFALYKWIVLNNDFFKIRNMKYMKPRFLFGNTGGLFINKYTASEFMQKLYQAFPDEPVYGMFDFRTPQYIIRDPEIVKQIAVKDFDFFEDHPVFADETIDKLWGNSLLFMKGEKWRQMRATLSPAFTGSKMRQMFELVAECTDEVVKHFTKKIENGEKVNVEMKDLFSRYTNDVIASCAYGLKINSLAEPENEFYINGKKLFDFTSFAKMLKILFILQMPAVARFFGIEFTDSKVSKIFRSTILDTMEIRKKNKIYRPDMINIMMEIREGTLKQQAEDKGKEKEREGFATVEESDVGNVTVNRDWNDDEIVAQCFIFFAGGSETTSTALTFAAYELTVNPDIQQRLYEEIFETNEKLNGQRITYDALQKMKYLDQVVCETLRKWPPLPNADRICVKNYVYDDHKFKFEIEKGKTAFIPFYGMHHDPKFFSDPEKFDPERFSDENKGNIISGTYLPFSIGPRNCIASRFANMVLKAALYSLLLNFSFEANGESQIPLKLKKSAFALLPERGVHLELKLRTN